MSFTRLSTASFFSMSSAKLENYFVQAKKLREMAFKSKKRVPPWHEALEAAARAYEGNPLITLLVPKWCMSNSLNGPFTTIFQMSILLYSPLARVLSRRVMQQHGDRISLGKNRLTTQKKDEYKCLVVVPQFFYPNHCYPIHGVALFQCNDFQTRMIGDIFLDKVFKK